MKFEAKVFLALAATLTLAAGTARAHHAGLSTLNVQVEPSRVRATLSIASEDLWGLPDGPRTPDAVAAVAVQLRQQAPELVELRLDETVVDLSRADARADGAKAVIVELEFPAPQRPGSLKVWSRHLARLPRGHKQIVTVRDSPHAPAPPEGGGAVIGPFELGGGAELVYAELPQLTSATQPATAPASRPSSAAQSPPGALAEPVSFFALGVEHILEGYDHLLFLAALLLAVERVRQAVQIITLFTVAHSITLALASLDVVRLDSAIVEPFIAASIVYVALENLWLVWRRGAQERLLTRGGPARGTSTPPVLDYGVTLLPAAALGWRSVVTFAFGLIHGLGFASVLRELGLGTLPGGVAVPLLKFNLGVEAGQLAVAAVFLPLLLLVGYRSARAKRLAVVMGSIAVAALGGWWLVERTILGG